MKRIAVVGLGLIGGSLAAAARAAGMWVSGYDVSPESTAIALQRGLIDDAAHNLHAALVGVEAVLLAVPVPVSLELLPALDAMAPSNALVMDTGSVKRPVVEIMAKMHSARRMVGGHPLAGSERAGPEAADAGLFAGRTFVLCSTEHTGAPISHAAETLTRAIGAEPLHLTAEVHDRVVARTSHLPQLASVALALAVRDADTALSGPALRDMTRLAAGPPGLWRDILTLNRAEAAGALREYLHLLEGLLSDLQDNDGPALERALAAANRIAQPLRGAAP